MHEGNGDYSFRQNKLPMEKDGYRMGPHLERAQEKKMSRQLGTVAHPVMSASWETPGKRIAEFMDDLSYTPKAYLKVIKLIN